MFMSVPPVCIKCEKIEDFSINIGNLNELMNYLDNYKCKKCEKMEYEKMTENLIDKNLSFKKQKKSEPLKSKKDFFNVLRIWALFNNKDQKKTISKKSYGGQPILWIKTELGLFYLNADTKMEGVLEFVSNESNDWHIIPNNRGKLNKVTNHPKRIAINGLYLYKEL